MSDLISRQTVLRCIKESRDNIDWGQSEDGDAFLHYTGALYRTIASEECLPSAEPQIIHCKDCKYRERLFCYGRGYHIQLVTDNGFCDKGETK